MTAYTILNNESIDEILKSYSVGKVYSHHLLHGGSENTNYLVRTARGSYVLTVCEQKSPQETENLGRLLLHLETSGFSTSRLIPTVDKKVFIQHRGKPLMLKTFLEGTAMDTLPPHLLTQVGAQLATLHQLASPDYLPKSLGYGQQAFEKVREYDAGSAFATWLMDVHGYLKPFFSKNLPKAMIHSDLFTSNIIVSQNETQATIMDFEEVAYYYRVFDIGMALVGLCRSETGIDLKKAAYFLKGYHSGVSLTTTEKKALQPFTVYAAAAMCFWRHRNFNHTNPTPELKDHYKELKAVADHVKGIPPATFDRNAFETS